MILLAVATGNTFGQKSEVLKAFAKYQIDESILDPALKKKPETYSFDLKYTSITSEKEKVTLATYDPSKIEAERWTVVSVDGKTPTSSEIKTFRKEHSQPSRTEGKVDESSYKTEKDDGNYLTVSYKQDPASLPAEASFMKDCRLFLTINVKTKRFEKLEAINEKPLKIKILNAQKLDLAIKFKYDEAEKRYFTESEDLDIIVKFLGNLVPIQTLSEYSNYKKI